MNVEQTPEFKAWLAGLKDVVGKRAILSRIVRVQTTDNFGDWGPIEDSDLEEMRVHVGPGYRVYYKRQEGAVILWGGKKGTQTKDIKKAKRLADGD